MKVINKGCFVNTHKHVSCANMKKNVINDDSACQKDNASYAGFGWHKQQASLDQ
jgi:hypothetical protein